MIVEQKEFKEQDGNVGYYECVYDSSNILKVIYFPKQSRFYIFFKRGDAYSYGNVSQELFEEFNNADSQGKFFAKKIRSKPDEYPYRKEFKLLPTEIAELNIIVEDSKKEEDE